MARTQNTTSATSVVQPGIIESLENMLRVITEYFAVRFELAGLESKTVFLKIAKAAAILGVAAIFLAAGFLYLSLSLVYVLAVTVGWGWGWALVVSGLSLLLLTVIGLLSAKTLLRGDWFPITLAELKKDTEWLKKSK